MCSYILWRGATKLTYITGDFAVTVLIISIDTWTIKTGKYKYMYNHWFIIIVSYIMYIWKHIYILYMIYMDYWDKHYHFLSGTWPH